jgi:diguanylate cyclase (GGDEF)-like protein
MSPEAGSERPFWSDDVRGTRGTRLIRARVRWAAIGMVVLLCGVLATAGVAIDQLDALRDQADRAYQEASEDVAAAVRLELQRQTDLLVSTGAYVSEHPGITSGHLERWIRSIRALERYPDLLGVLFVRLVDHEELDAYLSDIDPGGALVVIPPGPREWYCLIQAVGYQADTEIQVRPGFDYCVDPALGASIEPVRLAGQETYQSGVEIAGLMPLLAIAPVYTGGIDPGTPDARAEVTLGGVVTVIDVEGVLDRVLADRAGLGVTLSYADEWSSVAFNAGDSRAVNGGFTTPLAEGWELAVTTSASVASAPITQVTWAVLVAGVLASAMLAGLLFVLGTSRARALDLVDDATEELRHLALHDSLTGLPNRVLLGDRLDRMVSRSTRDGTLPVALFVDLDGFKEVNDTLGHGAGDALLRAVAERLTSRLRGVDTIARLGGDEFVVLLDVEHPDAASDVATRVVEAMRHPFDMGDGRVAEVTASVGVAVGLEHGAASEWLLREADLALYDAKAAGRDQWKVAAL